MIGREVSVNKVISSKDLALTVFTAMNKRDPMYLSQHLSENAVFDFPGPGRLKGKKRILTFLKILFRKYPQLQFTIEDIFGEGERVCTIWSNQGTDNKGNSYKNRGITLVRASEGKIVFISDYFKDTSFVNSA